MVNLVDLKTCYIKQVTTEKDGKGDWIVFNTKDEQLHELHKSLTELEVMVIINFGRKFEIIAFNKGIVFQKKQAPKEIKNAQAVIRQLSTANENLLNENEKLATELEKQMQLNEV